MQNIEKINLKNKFIIFSIKKMILPLIFCLFTIFLIIFSNDNLIAAKEGLSIWVNNVVPSLFPFFIATELLLHTNIIYYLGKILNPIMRPLFNIPGVGSFALIMGIISGYPVGAKIVCNLKDKNLCTLEEAERLLAFTNNSGPLFILGTVGILLFGNSNIGYLLLITHILACISVGFIFRFWKKRNNNVKNTISEKLNITKDEVCFSNLGEILGNSIFSSIKTILIIGGFITLFSVLITILKNANVISFLGKLLYPLLNIFGINNIDFSNSIIYGLLELTNGLNILSLIPCNEISINIIISAFLLGFGGISVLLQVNSIVSKSKISIKSYFIGKLLQGILASIYTAIFINFFPIFNL